MSKAKRGKGMVGQTRAAAKGSEGDVIHVLVERRSKRRFVHTDAPRWTPSLAWASPCQD